MMSAQNWRKEDGSRTLSGGSSDPAGPVLNPKNAVDLPHEGALASDREELLSRPEWQLACRVAASKSLVRSGRLARFLLYVCEQYLLGRPGEITEQRIGRQIFDRSSGYNPGEDNIVRSYARMLRKRLDAYFDGEGAHETMRIYIPRGGYVPVFNANPKAHSPVLVEASGPNDADPGLAAGEFPPTNNVFEVIEGGQGREARSGRHAWSFGLLGLVAGILLASVGWWGTRAVQAHIEQPPAHAIWAQLFQRNRNTLIVPADSGLGILQNLSRHPVAVEEYANGSYLDDVPFPPGLDKENFNDLRRQRYTSIVCLNITTALTRLPEFIANRTQIRYARSVTAEDIKNSNVILLGSKNTNPWVSLFEKKLNFRLEYNPEVDDSFVLNENPSGKEQKIYRNSTDETSNLTYGAIAYLPDLNGAGHVLIIQGLNMAATQAAADTLFNAGSIDSILPHVVQADGTLRSFELLIETTSVGATAPGAQVIATRIYPQ
jgi:hypothetical protein